MCSALSQLMSIDEIHCVVFIFTFKKCINALDMMPTKLSLHPFKFSATIQAKYSMICTNVLIS